MRNKNNFWHFLPNFQTGHLQKQVLYSAKNILKELTTHSFLLLYDEWIHVILFFSNTFKEDISESVLHQFTDYHKMVANGGEELFHSLHFYKSKLLISVKIYFVQIF